MFLVHFEFLTKIVDRALDMDKENVGITSKIIKQSYPTPSRGFRWTDEDQLFLKQFYDYAKINKHYYNYFLQLPLHIDLTHGGIDNPIGPDKSRIH